MNMSNLPVGTIFMSNNTRLIVVGYNKNNQGGYIVCPCSESEVLTNKLYSLLSNQIEKVLSLGYVDNNINEIINNSINPFENNIVPTKVPVNQTNINSSKNNLDF